MKALAVTDKTPFVTNGKFVALLVMGAMTAATVWGDLKHAISDLRRDGQGVVHVDDIERLEIQIQILNQSANLRMPAREQFMRRSDGAMVARATNAPLAIRAEHPAGIDHPASDQNPVAKSHGSLSFRFGKGQPFFDLISDWGE